MDQVFTDAISAAWAAYRQGKATEGVAAARRATEQEPRHGEGWYALACCLERAGRLGDADRAFHRAAQAREEPRDLPYRISWKAFLVLVDQAAGTLPEALRIALGEVTVAVVDYAEAEILAEAEEPEILGLFSGHPRGDRLEGEQSMDPTPSIQLFRRAHEHACASREELAAEVRRTLIHEFGHYLGYDEDDLERLGWE